MEYSAIMLSLLEPKNADYRVCCSVQHNNKNNRKHAVWNAMYSTGKEQHMSQITNIENLTIKVSDTNFSSIQRSQKNYLAHQDIWALSPGHFSKNYFKPKRFYWCILGISLRTCAVLSLCHSNENIAAKITWPLSEIYYNT